MKLAIALADGRRIDCAALRTDAVGATLELPPGTLLPERFSLALEGDAATFSVRVLWHHGDRTNVQFEAVTSTGKVP